ncbi:CatB-related O-acetyltransferase [uncultured Luteimonas sp.]|uniref:CatB-related O-acetyltransferase n=1 Tax=uncultured Luteimonas sp. TaxID=453144 RepID=UPI002612B376|nr:CatB-related O-acetyltransferase [uncultured Luteimonas sp.]
MNLPFLLRNPKHWIKRIAWRSTSGRVVVGKHTYGAPRIRWWGEDANLTVGKYCSIAEGVEIYLGGNHRTDWVTTFPFSKFPKTWPAARAIGGHPASRGDVVIGHDVWLGAGCLILSGVRIGDGAVVGARAVVGRDVPPYSIVAGNPATAVRRRFDEATIARLLAIAWWNWPHERVERHAHLLMSGMIEEFLATCARDTEATS